MKCPRCGSKKIGVNPKTNVVTGKYCKECGYQFTKKKYKP